MKIKQSQLVKIINEELDLFVKNHTLIESKKENKEQTKEITSDDLAKFFHDTYERLAPEYSYKTKKETAVDWDKVPENNKNLMKAVAQEVIDKFIKNNG